MTKNPKTGKIAKHKKIARSVRDYMQVRDAAEKSLNPVLSHGFMKRIVKKMCEDNKITVAGGAFPRFTVAAMNRIRSAVDDHAARVNQLAQNFANTDVFGDLADKYDRNLKKGDSKEKTLLAVRMASSREKAEQHATQHGLEGMQHALFVEDYLAKVLHSVEVQIQEDRDKGMGLEVNQIFSVPIKRKHMDMARQEIQRAYDLAHSQPVDFPLGDFHVSDSAKKAYIAKENSEAPLPKCKLAFAKSDHSKKKKDVSEAEADAEMVDEEDEEDEDWEPSSSEDEADDEDAGNESS